MLVEGHKAFPSFLPALSLTEASLKALGRTSEAGTPEDRPLSALRLAPPSVQPPAGVRLDTRGYTETRAKGKPPEEQGARGSGSGREGTLVNRQVGNGEEGGGRGRQGTEQHETNRKRGHERHFLVYCRASNTGVVNEFDLVASNA
jgi:hypothetical protein